MVKTTLLSLLGKTLEEFRSQGYVFASGPQNQPHRGLSEVDHKIKRILIIDDDPMILDIIPLTVSGFHFTKAISGTEGLQILAKNRHTDIVLLDYEMHQLNGLQTLRLIKENYPDLKVIMMTGTMHYEALFEAVSTGADAFVLKPFDVSTLTYVIRQVVEKN